ncbi:D-aspartate oxidase isoform X2 [Venturia canescens]|uniref:D-aspartate oxidase isoform X2 n=1 Tax=Venturia canescens TaxID=32260 RepID=UPI001C9CA44C|nr:D-aspartate oxidase isoform X2 [Venturia canescens]
MNIAVIGAGVIGVSSAVAVQKAFPKSRVSIFADVFTPDTTGDGSAGLWGPFIIGDTPVTEFTRYGGATHRWLEHFWKRGLAQEIGLSLIPVIRVRRGEGFAMPEWKSEVYGAAELSQEELKKLSDEHKTNYRGGMRFVTYTVEPARLLPWLMKKFAAAGGIIQKMKINSFDELAKKGYDTVINCSGIGARELASDTSLLPVRGQVTRVEAPWALGVFIEEDSPGNYIIPNIETVIIGGTATPNDYDTNIRATETNFILKGCSRISPALEDSKVVKHWCGLRPKRTKIRVEKETRSTEDGKIFEVIHNYGHGGAGVTVFWGCALRVVEILRESTLDPKSQSSKL